MILISRYFLALQKELESYDCVLYEMVASRESLENRRNATTTKRLKSSRTRGFNILGCIQRQMARILTLDFQLDCLNYESSNWYHADLDYETFKLLQVLNCLFFLLNSTYCTDYEGYSEYNHWGVVLSSQYLIPCIALFSIISFGCLIYNIANNRHLKTIK